MQNPTTVHYQSAIRVLRYLSHTKEQGILLASQSHAKLAAYYCDSDWAGCLTTRRSTTDFCLLLGKSPLSWKSKRQSTVARSTAEAEYRALPFTRCEVLWIKQLLMKDLGMKQTEAIVINCDNQAALAIAVNRVYHERMKHVVIDHHFVREHVKNGEINPTYVRSQQQLADVFTKILPVAHHEHLLDKLGVHHPASHLP